MTLTGSPAAPPVAPMAPAPARRGVAGWAADLAMGARFAVTGGREGWARTLLTALGVGLGVTLLLLATSVPEIISARDSRSHARTPTVSLSNARGPETLLISQVHTTFHEEDIQGVRLYPEGDRAAAPPGVERLPATGEMVVSPALGRLLDSAEGERLAERLPYRVTGTIDGQGLLGPHELFFYAGVDRATAVDDDYFRADGWEAGPGSAEEFPPELVLLIVIGCVVLLMPIVIFIATAVRFGGERRDRRLAALRLVGADGAMTRRIAAGEALCGALLGLAVGGALFALARQLADRVEVWGYSAFPSDVTPAGPLAALVLLAVPACAVVVTMVALRGVAIEPLGVVRQSRPRRRRLWWRLLLPVLGLGLLLPLIGGYSGTGGTETAQVTAGAVLVLIGTTALLPWAVESVVERFRGGPLPWQLATRRLQLGSGPAARAVSGITVAVAGAIAVQMLFASVEAENTKVTGQDTTRAQFVSGIELRNGLGMERVIDAFRDTEGVDRAVGLVESLVTPVRPDGRPAEPGQEQWLTYGACDSLRELARLPDCRDGQVYLVAPASDDDPAATPRPGDRLDLRADATRPAKDTRHLWTVPRTAQRAESRIDPLGSEFTGVLVTPGALELSRLDGAYLRTMLTLDPAVDDAMERARNTEARFDERMNGWATSDTKENEQFTDVRRGLFIGATATLLLIGASMIVSMLEQLRERRRLLAVLVAFGTPRATLAWSVLWQTAVPVVIGLAISVAGGLTLGTVLLRMVGSPVAVDWTSLAFMAGTGAGVIALVTLVSMGPLWRMMRPDGLRSE
ncbi:FtsX-like permease family protein [Streptomyces pactum]|uniref:FtsX-like permease family protein n=1 Tax=Streptomyces pactum TaxID=68249 RepID=UPI0036FD64BD